MDSVSPTAWGARIDYDNWRDRYVAKDKVVAHWVGTPVSRDTATGVSQAAEIQTMRAIERHHILVRGWRGFAYAYGLGNTGTLYRARGLRNQYGAHDGDLEPDGVSENLEGIPICFLIGEGQKPSDKALSTFEQFVTEVDLPPYGHRDIKDTTCPGADIYRFVNDLKDGKKRNKFMSGVSTRLDVAVAFAEVLGEWPTPTSAETAQVRLTRIARDIDSGKTTLSALYATLRAMPKGDITNKRARLALSDVPAWVLTPGLDSSQNRGDRASDVIVSAPAVREALDRNLKISGTVKLSD